MLSLDFLSTNVNKVTPSSRGFILVISPSLLLTDSINGSMLFVLKLLIWLSTETELKTHNLIPTFVPDPNNSNDLDDLAHF